MTRERKKGRRYGRIKDNKDKMEDNTEKGKKQR
jgi:hypothetical protein